MQFFSDCIPTQVLCNIVYTDTSGADFEAQYGEISSNNRVLTTKEVHNFVKAVVANNKYEVYSHLVDTGVRLCHDDLLYLACQAGAGDMAQLIMENKVEPVDYVTKYGWTGVEIAAINGHYDIVKLLVQGHGANVNWVNPHSHYTPLENAIEGGHLHTVR